MASILDAASDAAGAAERDAEAGRPTAENHIVLLPTGAGKSLCFQIPALLLDGPTLVVYPLLALMSDQKRRLDEANLPSAVFRGGQSPEEREDAFRQIKNGARLILANPEALSAGNLAGRLAECGIAHIAIDEAHCVSEWGDTFRPAYVELGRIVRAIGAPVVTAFTATASPEVLGRISDILFGGSARIIRSDSDRPNIRFYVKKAAAKQQAALLLARTERRPMLLFCGTRSAAEDMAHALTFCFGDGAARFYHAGLEREEKKDVESWFFSRNDAILCATCAYGMGVDKRNIRTVVHLAPPDTAEAYIQEAGRGGRDGETADAILLWNYADHARFKRFPPGSRKSVMRLFAESQTCRRQVLLDALGAEQAACSGCDICDQAAAHRNAANGRQAARADPAIPGAAVQDGAAAAFALIRRRPRHYTAETLEDTLLSVLNRGSQEKIGIAVWDHAACTEIIGELLSSRRILRCAFPWRG
ncbi:MAG: RecQ family ATP-dependent DNA helicase, partial [Treponemataceae bacterium]|nr:RecQ family ATP-dependent DNA helicase [Treponemataceae bacterium]